LKNKIKDSKASFKEIFNSLDENKDGLISETEF
jgi:Ca2+-binding EF-hand superfamily protein